jgi:hypothetical protein
MNVVISHITNIYFVLFEQHYSSNPTISPITGLYFLLFECIYSLSSLLLLTHDDCERHENDYGLRKEETFSNVRQVVLPSYENAVGNEPI